MILYRVLSLFFLLAFFSPLPWIGLGEEAFSQNINPYRFLATLQHDDQYQDYFTSKKEQMFPVSFRFNTMQDGNNDSVVSPEDACENIVRYAIGDSVYGIGRTGLANRGPNDQRPVIYFHLFKRPNYDVYEYWLYYADNDYLNDHEHDWEKYFVYVQDTTPVYVRISNHSNFNLFSWCELTKDTSHPVIGVDGGSHAMGKAVMSGVQIRYNGEVSKKAGKLDVGDGKTIPWRVFSNDTVVVNVLPFNLSPDTFFYGDPVYPYLPQLSDDNEYGSPNNAPWKRSDWDNPDTAPIVYLGADKNFPDGDSALLDAGTGYAAYLWSTGATSQTIAVSVSGSYSVTVTDSYGCSSRDTVNVFVNPVTVFENKVNASETIAVYPNPANDYVRFVSRLPDGRLTIFNVSGKIIYQSDISGSIEINTLAWKKGIYFYRIESGNKLVLSGKLYFLLQH